MPAATTMRSLFSPAGAGIAAPTQMIWLPGAYDGAQTFLDEGFADAVAKRRARLDLVFVDLEMAHLDDREPLERLRSEIVLPAQRAGVSVWLAGMLIDEIAAGALAQAGEEHRIWRYIKARSGPSPLYLGYGREDRFAKGHALMAAELPEKCVDVIEGGHDWRTWFKLWERFLDLHFE